MAKGFKHGGGGGSASSALNFKIVGGTSQPASASEHTVWVNTDTDITGWVFASAEPEAPAEGLVWISIGIASAAAFNAVKKQQLMVYPIGAKQYIDGAWANKGAQIFLDGAWVSFSTEAVYLYLPGDVCESVTGGYAAEGLSETGSASSASVPAVTYGDESMVILPGKGSLSSTAVTYKGGIVRTANKIDLSGFSTLNFEGSVEGIGTGTGKLSIWSEIGSAQNVNRVKYASLTNGADGIALDVSDLDGSYYIGFGFDSANVQIMVTMTCLRLE